MLSFTRHPLIAILVLLPLAAGIGCGQRVSAADGPAVSESPSPPAAAVDPAKLADQVQRALITHDLRPWYPRAVDREKGGFHEAFDARWNRVRGEEDVRSLVGQSRLTWTAAAAALHLPQSAEEYAGYARHGVRFLRSTMRDPQHGGLFFQRTADGKPAATFGEEKHAYGLAFAIYACAAAHRVAPDSGALELAIETFRWLDRHGHDDHNGGYYEAFQPDGSLILRPEDSPTGRKRDCLGTVYGYKDQNTHLHLLEAFIELYRVWPDPLLRQRLEELLVIMRDRIQVPPGCLNLYFTPDWRPLPDHDSFGHDVEAAYLMVEAADALGRPDDPTTWAAARALVDHALAWGWDKEHLGFHDKGAAFRNAHDRRKVWWTQAEGLNALLLMHDRYGHETPVYRERFEQLWSLIHSQFLDAEHGGWHATLEADGTRPPNQHKGGPWKLNYHSGRALMNVMQRLRSADARRAADILPAEAVAQQAAPEAQQGVATGVLGTGPTTAPATLKIDVQPGPNPWTHLKLREDPNEFHFAVVSDNAGAMRPGRFDRAVTSLNLLQPRFVLSIGDFINGYRPTAAEINAMWDEFIPQTLRLEPPFFYVPGNHDTASPVMRPIWHERFGRSYYHFRYRDVLFLCLDSMDREGGIRRGLGEEQLAYFKRVLAEEPAPRWTFVLCHRPMWRENGSLGWEEFEKLLGDRPYTVFTGHYHQYLKEIRNGREYYTLSVTGGGNLLRGPEYGDFDHIVWVTMTADGPRIANVEFDGVHDNDVRTPANETIAWHVERAAVFQPVRLKDETITATTATLRLFNGSDVPVRIVGSIRPHPTFEPSVRHVDVELAARPRKAEGPVPGIERRIAVELTSGHPVRVEDLAPLVFEGTATYDVPGKGPSNWPIRYELKFDRTLAVQPVAGAVRVDGALDEWAELPHDLRPMHIGGAARTWEGPADAAARFAIRHDQERVYLAARVLDDRVIATTPGQAKPGSPMPTIGKKGDGVEFWLDARPDGPRLGGVGSEKNLFKTFLRVSVFLMDGKAVVEHADRMPEGITAAARPIEGGYEVEVAVPASWLDEAQKRPWQDLRLNVDVLDTDAEGAEPARLWWRPAWGSKEDFPGSGTFAREP